MTDRLEDELRRALRRGEPPEGFTERVLAAAAEPSARRMDHPRAAALWFHSPVFRWAMVAAACLLLVTGAARYRQHRIEARGEAAKAQLMLALRITGGKLEAIRAKVVRMENQP
jgi:hypothetical protein